MPRADRPRWLVLCQAAVEERNTDEFANILQELNEVLNLNGPLPADLESPVAAGDPR